MSFLKNRKNKQKQRGFVSMEIMIGIAVVALIIAGILIYINKMIESKKAKTEVENIAFISNKVQELFSQDASYEDVSADILIKAGAIPAGMTKGGDLVNAWKNAFTISAGDDNSTYKIVSNGIPAEQCPQVANAFRKQAINLKIGSTPIITDGDEGTGVVAKIATACASGAKHNFEMEFK